LCFVSLLFSQVRLTNDPDSSFTSDNNAQSIAAHGDIVQVVWTDGRFGNNEVFYKRSLDRGISWDDDIQVSLSSVGASYPSIGVNGDTVHVVWMDQRNTHIEIYYKRSVNNGVTWGPDIRLTNGIGESAYPSIAVSGHTVHVVWQYSEHKANEIFHIKSIDGGTTWLPETRISNALSNVIRPSIAVFDKFIHVVWEKPDGSGIFYKRSLDDGNTWLPQYELTTLSAYSEHPMLTVSDTMIFAFWSDRRSGNGDIYMRRSVDNGDTWENDVKLPSHPNQAIRPRAASNGTFVYLVWSEINIIDWATFEEISTDAGVSWTSPAVSMVNHGTSTRPFIAINDREVHIIATEESDGNMEIYYSRGKGGNPFLDHNKFEWGHGLGSTLSDIAYDVAADSSGNVYVTGSFESILDFDPGPGIFSLASSGGTDIFIAKYDPTGQLQWAKRAGGPEDDVSYGLELDHEGHVVATGGFSNIVDFDPGPATSELTSFGQADIFILKLDTAGNFLWVKQMGGEGSDVAYSITLDANKNILTTGFFSDTADFDPSIATITMISNGSYDLFVSKIDPNGQFLWAGSAGSSNVDAGHSITTDGEGAVLLTGFYSDTVDFDPGIDVHVLKSNGRKDIFILKLNADGQWLWADSFGAEGDDKGNSIICDKSGNVYSTGSFRREVDFNPDLPVVTLQSHGLDNVFIIKLDPDGHYGWAESFQGYNDEGKSITLDHFGNVYTTGSFSKATDFDPGPLQLFLYANMDQDVFISKLSHDGKFIWINQLSNSSISQGNAIDTRSSAYVYCAGYYFDDIDLDPTLGIDIGEFHESEDFFLLQLKQCDPRSSTLNVTTCEPFLAPDGITVWTASGTYQVIIPTSLGCDSVITVHLTFAEPTETDVDVSSCNEFISPEGNIWTISGTYQVVLTNIAGCDSTINYHVTILEESATDVEVSACETYSTPDGLHTWTESGTYPLLFTNIAGCDSVVSYHVTILQDSETEVVASACNQYATPDGLHTWTASGLYPITFLNFAGCDSIVTYNITIHNDRDTSINITTCDHYSTPDGQHSWNVSGVYLYTVPSFTGCDSNITVTLTIVEIDTSISTIGNILSANQTGAGYQWIDCDNSGSVLPGETNQSFLPDASGNYAVVIGFNGCADTSSCYAVTVTGTSDIENDGSVKIYPNPASDLIHIDLMQSYSQIDVELLDLDGRILKSATFRDQQFIQLIPDLPPGLYLINVTFNDAMVVAKVNIN
jgi:hypothetical protein